mmetsp:Transcript_14616/g.23231  ORF Transcript_14616/g.23231 Transcript_14616/m.23231 type:complete len:275 (+) Transcript_14616:45-869(+)
MESTGDEPSRALPPRFNHETFFGRMLYMFDQFDPRPLFATETQLKEAKVLVEGYQSRKSDPSPQKLEKAQKLVECCLHPDTKEPIFVPFRVSAFLPIAIPIGLGLLQPNAGIGSVIFWQWMNQTHAAAMNYGNRPIQKAHSNNATSVNVLATPWDSSIKIERRAIHSYLGAVGAAMGVSLSVRSISMRIKNKTLLLLAPVCGVVSAAVANLYLTRKHELEEGIEVETPSGKCVGRSQIAAEKAIIETAISRAVLPLPSLGLTPFMFQYLESAPW